MAKRPNPRGQRVQVVTIPAPYGGWNARDALTSMEPTDAIRLENLIPDTSVVKLRSGYAAHSTGVGTRVDSLMAYTSPTTSKLFAASSGGKIYDVTATSTATNTATATAFTNGQFQHVMMGTGAGSFLVVCNGADVPFYFDGSGWATASITGCTAGSSAFVGVTSHQSRLWFIENNTLDAWYLPSSSIQGAAVRLQLGPYCKKGGYLQAIASWTRDGGAGMDDQLIFMTSKGEAVIYSGTDPSSSTLWAKVGTFQIPEPVGRRCVTQIGADLALITSQGVIPLSQILPLSPGGAAKVAATDKISGAFQDAYANGSAMFGWQAIENSKERLLIINVPSVEHTTTYQFVMNVMNGAWCKFSAINTNCWASLGDQIYFGGVDGTVYRYGASTLDNSTAAISAVSASAFTDLGSPANKQFQMVRTVMYAPDGLVPGVGIHLDYNTENIAVFGTNFDGTGTFWDVGDWDTFNWAGGAVLSREWHGVNGIGTAVSVEAQFNVTDAVRFNSMDIMFEPGGYL